MIASDTRRLPASAALAAALTLASGAATCKPAGDGLVDSWRVTVDGESRARTLQIRRVAELVRGEARVFAVYGWYGEELSAVRVILSEDEGRMRLRFTSQLGSQIDLTESDDGGFQGSFRTPAGQVKPMQMRRMNPGEDRSPVAPQLYIVEPGADVPVECARFSGLWAGQWIFFQGEKFWIWVLEVDTHCKAKIAYQTVLSRPRRFDVLDVRGGVGVMTVPNGSLAFKVSGNELRVNWNSSTFVIDNSAQLKRIEDVLP